MQERSSVQALNPRSLLFTLYGDYVRPLTGSSVPVHALVAIAGELGVTATALRTALSRMTGEGWLEPERVTGRPAYRLTERGAELIREGAERIYERRPAWNGSWLVVCYSLSEGRRRERDRLRSELSFLGFGSLGNGIWLSPHDLRHEVGEILLRHAITEDVAVVYGALDWPEAPSSLVARAWDLAAVATRYADFVARTAAGQDEASRLLAGGELPDREAFCRRFLLTHEFRRFPFADPDLPPELLPGEWIGHRARSLFLEYNVLLKPAADRFFLSTLGG